MNTDTLIPSILEAALEGLTLQHSRITEQIAVVKAQLNGSPVRAPQPTTTTAAAEPKPARRLSAAGRKAIADAARKRWAALKQEKAKAEKAAAEKRTAKKATKKAAKAKKTAKAVTKKPTVKRPKVKKVAAKKSVKAVAAKPQSEALPVQPEVVAPVQEALADAAKA